MLVSFDTEKEDVEQLKRVLEILQQVILSKTGGQGYTLKTIPDQPANAQQNTVNNTPQLPQEHKAPSSIQAQQAQAIFSYANKVDMSKIYQSNAGIQKRREMRYRHNY